MPYELAAAFVRGAVGSSAAEPWKAAVRFPARVNPRPSAHRHRFPSIISSSPADGAHRRRSLTVSIYKPEHASGCEGFEPTDDPHSRARPPSIPDLVWDAERLPERLPEPGIPSEMAISGPATATAGTSICAAGPGSRREKSLGRRFLGDVSPATSVFARAAGAAPRLSAVRCNLRAPQYLITSTASRPLLPASPARELTATASHPLFPAPGTALNIRKRRQKTCYGRNPLPAPEIPWYISVVMKSSRYLSKEMVRIAQFVWQWIEYTWSRPEMKKLCVELKKVLKSTYRKVLDAIVAATNDPPSTDVRATGPARRNQPSKNAPERQQTHGGPLPPPETPWCFSVAMKLPSELAQEVRRIARFLWHWIQYICPWLEMEQLRSKLKNVLRRTLVKMLYALLSAIDDTPSVDGSLLSAIDDTPSVDGSLLSAIDDTPSVDEHSPLSKARLQRQNASVSKTTQTSSKSNQASKEHSPLSGSKEASYLTTTQTSSKSNQASKEHSPLSKARLQRQDASVSKTTQLTPDIWSKYVKNVKKRVNRKARELVSKLSMEDWNKILTGLRQDGINGSVLVVAAMTTFCVIQLVDFRLLALQCKKAVLDYNVQQKLLVAGAVMWNSVLWAVEAFKQAEKSYKIHAKVLFVWMKAQDSGKVAETASTILANMEKLYQIIEKLRKGAQSP